MMVLLVASSLIGISSIHQFVEGQKPPPAATPKPQQPVTLKIYKRILISASHKTETVGFGITMGGTYETSYNIIEFLDLPSRNELRCDLDGTIKILCNCEPILCLRAINRPHISLQVLGCYLCSVVRVVDDFGTRPTPDPSIGDINKKIDFRVLLK